jgi:hypothetical protein
MPPGVKSADTSFIGEHSCASNDNSAKMHFAWLTNNGHIDFITQIFSHELVESCTDPEGDGFLGNPGTCSFDDDSWCEIGDVCEGIFETVNGVSVQAY